jgi:prevent-host-death family protein
MKVVGLFEAKAKLSEICERVASAQEPVLITRRGKPLVRIEPIRAREVKSVWRAREAFVRRSGRIDVELVVPRRRLERRREVFE